MIFVVAALTLSTEIGASGSTPVSSLEDAVHLFQDENYAAAALRFHGVLQTEVQGYDRDEAQYYLGLSLLHLKLWGAATHYFQRVVDGSSSDRRVRLAVEHLLSIQEKYREHAFVAKSLEKLTLRTSPLRKGEVLDRLKFLLAEFRFREGHYQAAEALLDAIAPERRVFPKARYLQGVVALARGRTQAALGHFESTLRAVAANADNPSTARLRGLTQLAIGRVLYGLGQFQDAVAAFESVSQHSEFWFRSLSELAWAHYQTEHLGRALGALESVFSPYFRRRHLPEAHVIQATAYFSYCQWDRVRVAIQRYERDYVPMLKSLEHYLHGAPHARQLLQDLARNGDGHYAPEIAFEVRRVRYFADLYFALRHLEWQDWRIEGIEEFKDAPLRRELIRINSDRLAATRRFAAEWVKRRLGYYAEGLHHFESQIQLLRFELVDAERQWLEQGRKISGASRARLSPSRISAEGSQLWGVSSEHWKGDLGYHQHVIRSECD